MAGPGLSQVTINGGVYIKSAATEALVDSTIKLAIPGDYAQAGAIQSAASRVQIHCEIDLGGKPIQGVQLIKYPATSLPPYDPNLDRIFVYNNALGVDPLKVGFFHGVYFQDSIRASMKNARFEDIRGGRALHFTPNAKDSFVSQVTVKRCYGDVVFWGANVTGNKVEKLLVLEPGAKTFDFNKNPEEVWGSGAQRALNPVDRSFDILSGYGYQPPTPPKQEIEALLKSTTISYPEWKKRVDNGLYNPRDGSGTNWGKALAMLRNL